MYKTDIDEVQIMRPSQPSDKYSLGEEAGCITNIFIAILRICDATIITADMIARQDPRRPESERAGYLHLIQIVALKNVFHPERT